MSPPDTGQAPISAGAELGSFSDFYEAELGGQVRRAALMLGSAEEADDVVHEAFVQVFRRWDRLEQPGPYLNRCVLNGCREAGRQRATTHRLLARMGRLPRDSAPDEVLADVLAALPFNQRVAVVLRFYAGMSTQEIACHLDCAPGSVGPWIDRALKRMRKALQ